MFHLNLIISQHVQCTTQNIHHGFKIIARLCKRCIEHIVDINGKAPSNKCNSNAIGRITQFLLTHYFSLDENIANFNRLCILSLAFQLQGAMLGLKMAPFAILQFIYAENVSNMCISTMAKYWQKLFHTIPLTTTLVDIHVLFNRQNALFLYISAL